MTADPDVLAGGIALLLLGVAAVVAFRTSDDEEGKQRPGGPSRFLAPERSFTVVLLAGHQSELVKDAVERISTTGYPRSLLEVLVVCPDDAEWGDPRRALELACARAHHDVVTIFDVDTRIHPDTFHIVNTTMMDERAQVVGVRLMSGRMQSRSALDLSHCPPVCATVFIRRGAVDMAGAWADRDLGATPGCPPETLDHRHEDVWLLDPVPGSEWPACTGGVSDADEGPTAQPFALVTSSGAPPTGRS